jgi:hypothetical protein
MAKLIDYLLLFFIGYIGISVIIISYLFSETPEFYSLIKSDCFQFSYVMIGILISHTILFLSFSGKIVCKFCKNNINCTICDCISFLVYCFINFYYMIITVDDIYNDSKCTKYVLSKNENIVYFFNTNMVLYFLTIIFFIVYMFVNACCDISNCCKKNRESYSNLENC